LEKNSDEKIITEINTMSKILVDILKFWFLFQLTKVNSNFDFCKN
jgi:hypothetical protein